MRNCVWLSYFVIINGVNLYVSPNGNNNNNGMSPESPFKSIEYTQYYIREYNKNYSEPIYVNLMDGVFYLKNSLNMTYMDSGKSNENSITYQSYPKNTKSAVISNGTSMPRNCWNIVNSSTDINVYSCNIGSYVNPSNPYFRSLRIQTISDNIRGIPVRYPKLYHNYSPYTEGWIMVNSSEYNQTTKEYIIGISNDQLPGYLRNSKYQNITGKMSIFPQYSWINMEIDVTSYYNALSNGSYSYFTLKCPLNLCNPNQISASITKGNRLFFYNISQIPIQVNYEWYYDASKTKLYIGLSNDISIQDTQITIPNSYYIINMTGTSNNFIKNIIFDNIIFTDNDYIAYGYQSKFNIITNDPENGVPIDGSIRLNYATNITIRNCLFTTLGGGGIMISNYSRNIFIHNNEFKNMGQSGVTIIGDSMIQATYIHIYNNTFENMGQILASAAGIYACTVSNSIFKFNNVTNSSRWGIAIRSQESFYSLNNEVSYNIIKNTGLKTRDYGGLSFIGTGYTNTTVTYNCVANSIGFDTDNIGRIMTPFYSFGIYLDNYATGFYIYGNILNNQVMTGIFIHGGSNNTIINNINYNITNIVYPGHTKMFGELVIEELNPSFPTGNILSNNVYYWFNKHSQLIDSNCVGNITAIHEWLTKDDYNLYYNPNINISNLNISGFNPCGQTYNDWINCGYDHHSIINIDPLFNNPINGNFNINKDSVLTSQLGFNPIPTYISQNC